MNRPNNPMQPVTIIGSAGQVIQTQTAKVEATILAAAAAWGRLSIVSAAGQPPSPDDRIAAVMATRAAQAELRNLADVLGDTTLKILAAFDVAMNEAPN